jgi:hypothetical protein
VWVLCCAVLCCAVLCCALQVLGVAKLGLAVIATFVVCWSPWLYSIDSAAQVRSNQVASQYPPPTGTSGAAVVALCLAL